MKRSVSSAPVYSINLNLSILESATYLKSLTTDLLVIIDSSDVVILVQGVFQVSAAQPVNYVIEEMEDLFNLDNEVDINSIQQLVGGTLFMLLREGRYLSRGKMC